MKFGVVIFPGSNCDMDLIHVLTDVSGQKVEELWHKDTDLKGCDFVFLPGGFSYGDYLRSGAIAKLSPIMKSVQEHAAKGGFVMGICNGFQILCESGLLPGALLRNEDQLFICDNVYLRTETNNAAVTRGLPSNAVVKIPIAHAEGRYYADDATIQSLKDNDQILFRYCEEDGTTSTSSNPNGSVENIAGICNARRNVFGMMPHPERAASEYLFNKDGLAMFEGILSATV
ncbi:MAG: phosphoribosylformylglycinamidine synthase subunit PurQ [Flavobacteriales bacterium]|nr:phosphoribosylformylglycinamidine synthase subunit PurQ [Bacteroidota bacterium]MCB9241643.1 phosphoribosylformylglycinamidine synthase subunit PurQ [Flavobacteriales bacterium]